MKKDVSKVLCDLVNIPSYGKIDSSHEIISYLKEAFGECVEIVKVQSENGNTHLLVGVNTALQDVSDCILLSGHIDTVAPTEGHEPVAKVSNGEIVGLGTADMKSFWASVISQLDEYKKCKKPVVIALTTDEETDLTGIRALTSEMKRRNITPSFSIVGEPTSSKYSVSNRGNSVFLNKMHGKACHSSTPELGINAISLCARMAFEVEKLNMMYTDSSLTVTTINGGKAPNIVPDACDMKFSVRTPSHAALREIKEKLSAAHQEISNGDPQSLLLNVFNIPPFERRNSPFVSRAAQKNGIEITSSAFTTEAGFIQEAFEGVDIVIYGVGAPDCIHKAGEKVDSKKLEKYSESLVEMTHDYEAFKSERKNEKNV